MIVTTQKKQKTIAKEVSLRGVGLHTGLEVTMTLKPADEDSGYVFIRTDLDNCFKIPAHVDHIGQTKRSTSLEKDGVRIMTCEHVLSALVGSGIDNAIIELDAEELPIADGSARPFVELIGSAGVVEQKKKREEFVVRKKMVYTDEETGSEIQLIPSDRYSITSTIDFDNDVLGSQSAQLKDIEDFADQIAKSRTFCLLSELEMLVDNDLVKGGDLNNAIVYVDKELSEETLKNLKKIFSKSEVSHRPNGVLDNLTLHFPNEAARHKLLDIIGDFALAGMPIQGHVIATKPGHGINTAFAQILSKAIKTQRRHPEFHIDLSAEPLYDVNGIMNILPQRPPFLFLDRVMEMSEERVIGVKNVTMNETFFQGHFPEEPIMPGVLQIEAMAQAGGILVLAGVPDPENYLTYFMKIDNVRFKLQVVPGDTLVFKLDLLSPIRRGICYMKGETYVNGKLASEAELMAKVVNTKKKLI